MRFFNAHLLVLATPVAGFSQTLTSASLSNNDVTVYEESAPGILSINNSASLTSVLQGSANAAGGNVELFTSSDSPLYEDPSVGGAFANANPTVLTAGFSSGPSVTVSGLNGQDWFTTPGNAYETGYGANNMANVWFGSFLQAMNDQSSGQAALFIAGNEADLFDTFRDNGGFAQMSDPNVSYIDSSDAIVSVGLGGFADATPRVADLLEVSPVVLSSIFQNGIQISEVAKVNSQAVYSFEAVDSGVLFDDGVDSYSATYVVSIPEPSSSVLLLLAGMSGLARRKR